jgi:hypothetical protein
MNEHQPTRRDLLKAAAGVGLAGLLCGGRAWASHGKLPRPGEPKPPARAPASGEG